MQGARLKVQLAGLPHRLATTASNCILLCGWGSLRAIFCGAAWAELQSAGTSQYLLAVDLV